MKFFNMKRVLIPLFFAIVLFSCGKGNQNPEEEQKETPEAIENNYSSGGYSSMKRGWSMNIIERLYKEAVEKNKIVNTINQSVELANNFYLDSLVDYNKYVSINKEYWDVANDYITAISDTVMRMELKTIFDKAESEYCSSNEKLLFLNDKIKLEKKHFENQVRFLKLAVTLPMIQNYQVNEIPDSSAMNSILVGFDTVNKQIQEFVK